MPRWLGALILATAFAAAFWRVPEVAAPAFLPPALAAARPAQPALLTGTMLPMAGIVAQAPSLVELADGKLAAAWTAGSDDTADDLAIRLSILDSDGWRPPQVIVSREGTAGALFAHVRRIGQPVLYREGGWLHLWYIAVGPGGSRLLVHTRSTDGGRQWSPPVRLSHAPLAGFGTARGGPPLPLADGGIGLPLAHDLFSAHGEWLRLDARGRVVDKARLASPAPAPQPVVAALDAQRALALSRDAGPPPGQVRALRTDNGGLAWTAVDAPGLPNPNLPLALLRLADGRLLLGGNAASGRDKLMLWLSNDDGQSWQESRIIEAATDTNAAFTAPDLLQGRDGRIHLVYLRRDDGIRHVAFTPAWLAGEQQ